jgi:hypothetical protein
VDTTTTTTTTTTAASSYAADADVTAPPPAADADADADGEKDADVDGEADADADAAAGGEGKTVGKEDAMDVDDAHEHDGADGVDAETRMAASPGRGGVQQQHTGQLQLEQHTEHLQQQHTADEATTRLRGRFVRRYRWGMLDVLDERHLDFVALRGAVMGWRKVRERRESLSFFLTCGDARAGAQDIHERLSLRAVQGGVTALRAARGPGRRRVPRGLRGHGRARRGTFSRAGASAAAPPPRARARQPHGHECHAAPLAPAHDAAAPTPHEPG